MKPVYQIHADDTDITVLIKQHFVSLALRDSSGLDSDSFTLILSDPHGVIRWPRKGVVLKVWLGYDTELHYKGAFIVDEVDYLSPPDQLQIVCRAADIKKLARERKTRHWGNVTLGTVIDTIAAEQGLVPAASQTLAAVSFSALWQTDETDLHFLARLAETHQAIAQVKNGRLLLTRRGSALTVSGQPMPRYTLNRRDCGSYHYSERRSEEFDAVRAKYREAYTCRYYRNWYWWRYRSYYTRTYYRTRYYQIGKGSGERVYALPGTFNNRAEAMAATDAMYNSLEAGASTLSVSLDQGQPQLMAEVGMKLNGFVPRVNELDWVVSEVNHQLDGSGLTGSLNLVRPMSFKGDS